MKWESLIFANCAHDNDITRKIFLSGENKGKNFRPQIKMCRCKDYEFKADGQIYIKTTKFIFISVYF